MSRFQRSVAFVTTIVLFVVFLGILYDVAFLDFFSIVQRPTIDSNAKTTLAGNTTDSTRSSVPRPPAQPTSLVAPAPPTFQIAVEKFKPIVQETLDKSKAIYDQISKNTNPSVEIISRLSDNERLVGSLTSLYFLAHVSPNRTTRDVATEITQIISDYEVAASMREDVYKVVQLFHATEPVLDPQANRYLEKTLLSYQRNGLSLSPESQATLSEMRKRMSNISIEFSRNLAEDDSALWFSRQELSGVPKDLVDSWQHKETVGGDEKYRMTAQYPDIGPTLKFATLESTRQNAWLMKETKVSQNTKLMVEMIYWRRQFTQVHGHEYFADYVSIEVLWCEIMLTTEALQDKMAKNVTTVMKFLTDLHDKAKALAYTDLEILAKVKEKQDPTMPLKVWDEAWATTILLEQDFDYSTEKTAEYFEMDHTITRVLSIYEALFDLQFRRIEKDDSQHDTWHEDVCQFSVWQSNPQAFVGWLYLDLFPREGKFGHAANMDIRTRSTDAAGKSISPATAIVCNFSKPTKTKPSLLKFSEVETFFHELGHGIHSLLADTEWYRFNSLSSIEHVCRATTAYRPLLTVLGLH